MSERILDCSAAIHLVLQHAEQMPTPASEEVPLLDALHRVTAQGIVADRDQPPFDRSTRDGFAVRAADAQQRMTILGQVRAGEFWHGAPLSAGQAVEIMTGAPLPAGADAVAMVEHTEEHSGSIRLQQGRTLRAGENVVERAAEASSGATLLPIGSRMHAGEIALAASLGYSALRVFTQPRVAVLATGDELVDIVATPATHQIRNSNSYGIAALVTAHGGTAQLAPPVNDSVDAVIDAIRKARNADLLILTGGVSAGKYDFVETALAHHHAEFLFTGVHMQPGRPVVFGRLPASSNHREQYFLGLPGNPVSTQVTFLLYAAPLLRALGGDRTITPRFVEARLATDVRPKPGLTRFLPAYLASSLDGVSVQLATWQGSGDLTTNAQADCYVVIPPDTDLLPAGTTVRVLLR